MIFRFIYFIAIGWWAGLLAALGGYLLCLSVIGLPFGLILLNRLPTIIILHESGEPCPEGFSHRHPREPVPFILRVIWFIAFGWELGLLAIAVGFILCLTVVGIPLGIYVLNRVPLLLTLNRLYA